MRLSKGTRAKIIHPFFNYDRIGDVFEVAECDSESITLNRCYSDSKSYLQASYTLTTEEFGNFFEVIGMEEPKKTSDDRVITFSLSEDELAALWAKSVSFDHFKRSLKRVSKDKDGVSKKQREWTDWKRWGNEQRYEYSVSRPIGQSAKVKVRTPDGFIGTASCSPGDDFDLDYGVELASIRAEIKNTEDDAARAFTDYLVEKRNVEDLKERLEKVLSRAYGKAAK